MKHRGIPNVHEIIVQNFCNPHELKDDLQFIRESKTCYIQANVMVSLSLMTTYIKHLRYLAKAKHFGPFYYIQIDPQDYDEWRISTPEGEIHFQTRSKFGSPATPRSMATSEASESYITLTNFKKGIKRDASAYPIFKNERYYNTDRIPSTTPGAEPPRDARDSGSARSHSMHLETSSSNRP